MNGNATFAGSVSAPNGAVTIDSHSTLVGHVTSDSLSVFVSRLRLLPSEDSAQLSPAYPFRSTAGREKYDR